MAGINEVLENLRGVIEDLRPLGMEKKAAITEWGLWMHAEHHDGKGFYEPFDVQHGLFVASMLQGFTRLLPGIELSNFYHLLNPMGLFVDKGRRIEESLMADVFRLYSPAFPGEALPLRVVTPDLAEGVAAVDAARLCTNGTTWLFLVDRGLREPAAVEIEGLGHPQEGQALVGDSWNGSFASRPVEIHGNSVQAPPMSILRVRFA